MIESLQSLRGIFALIIFFHHFRLTASEGVLFEAGGDCGVAFFFVLSGFVLCLGYSKRTPPATIKGAVIFTMKRMAKIYPLHVLCLLWSLYLSKGYALLPTLSNLFLLQSWVPVSEWYFSCNAVGWCLSDFLLFYLLFPLIFSLFQNHKKIFLSVFLTIITLYIVLVVNIIPENLQNAIIYINPATRLMDFIIGIIVWELCNDLKIVGKSDNVKQRIPSSFVVILFVFTVVLWYYIPVQYNLSILWWPATIVIIMFAVGNGRKFLSNRYLIKFGDISFSFYLIHVLMIFSLDILFRKMNLNFHPLLRMTLILLITAFTAYILHRYFVLPIEKSIRKHITPKLPV